MSHRLVTAALACSLFLGPAGFVACSDDDAVSGHDDHDHDDAGSSGGSSGSGGKSSGGASASGGKASGGTAGAGGGPSSGGSTTDGGDAGDAGAVSVTLNFKAKVGAQDLACGTTYDAVGKPAARVSPLDFRMFVQDVALIAEDGSRVPVALDVAPPWQNGKVAFLDFEDATGDCASGFATTTATNRVVTGTVPPGNYKGIAFSNGVPEEWNHADPATLPEPLQAGAAMSWGWLMGYRFGVFELNVSLAGDAGTNQAWVHLGSTGCTNTPLPDGGTDFEQPPTAACANKNRNEVVLDGFELGKSVIVIDAAKIFADIDVGTAGQSGCHGMGPACPAGYGAMGVDFATGAAGTQTVYRLE